MAMFENYPTIGYQSRAMRDMSIRVVFRDTIKNNRNLYFNYTIQDQETPEDIAYDHYGSANDHWVLLWLNDVIDPLYDWPLSRTEIMKFTEKEIW